jgi:hypothetical protein
MANIAPTEAGTAMFHPGFRPQAHSYISLWENKSEFCRPRNEEAGGAAGTGANFMGGGRVPKSEYV